MKLRFWGVRGSFATPGPEYLRYGGNTTAIELQSDDGHRLLIDLGTGATEFAKELMAGVFGAGQGTLPILLTHTHLDHIQGLPFFTPFFIKGNQIRIIGAEPAGMSLTETLQTQLNGHYSPLYGLQNLAAGVSIEAITAGSEPAVDGFAVRSAALPHGDMSVLGYRICADEKVVAILSDIEHPEEALDGGALELARSADLLVHDATYRDDEYETRRGWGHSNVGRALEFAVAAKAKRLALFHHGPDATDDALDKTVADAKTSELDVFAAAEGPAIIV